MPKIGDVRIGLGGRVGHVVGTDDEGDTSALGEFRIDVLELERLQVVGHIGFGQQHVHVPGHAAGDRDEWRI